MAMMEIRNVHKTFRTYAKAGLRPGAHKVVSELPVLQGVDLTVEKGDVVAILGPSGSGKTTLLRCLNFLERPDTGVIKVNGETMWDAADPATQRESEVRKKRLHFGPTSPGCAKKRPLCSRTTTCSGTRPPCRT